MKVGTVVSAAILSTALAGKECDPVCEQLYCHSNTVDDIYKCNAKCCWDVEPEPSLEDHHLLGQGLGAAKNYSKDVSRSPDCHWDKFEACREQYTVDWNYYARYVCVVDSGCVSWSTFDLDVPKNTTSGTPQ